jgi:uncharacterized protein YdiU (UPF0061 family)
MRNKCLIEAVYDIELDMFDHVHRTNGKPLTPAETATFRIMRLSMLRTWPEELLISYLHDLESAKDSGINLMAVKYGRMMEHTAPKEYECIKRSLPLITDEKRQLVEKLTTILMTWEAEIRNRFRFLDRRGRPLHAKQDSSAKTSFETYTRGELANASEETLRHYLVFCESLMERGGNGAEAIYRNMVQMYGYGSLEDAAGKFQ